LGEVEENKQKSEEPKRKSEEGKKKRISVPSPGTMRQWQTFILAVIIIAAYVVFFAWIISTSPTTKDPNGVYVRNYDGMTTLAGTFGVIAAAVVGYYFGTRNLEQATNMAVEAKKEADESKVKLKNELDDRVQFSEKGKDVYDEAKKVLESTVDSVGKIDPTNKEVVLGSISKDVNTFIKDKLEKRIKEVDTKLATKKEQRDMIKNY
jgi:Na+/glutamate symporter